MVKKLIKNTLRTTLKRFGICAVRVPKPHTPDVIFIAVPKTGSQSVRAALHQKGLVEYSENSYGHFQGQDRGMVSFGHLHLDALREAGIVDETFFAKAFKFAFVRNPYDRLYSAYSYLSRLGLRQNATSIQSRIHRYKNFRDFVLNEIEGKPFTGPGLYKVRENSLLAPQVQWLDSPSGAPFTDFVGRFERLEEDWEEVCSKVGLANTQLPKLNTSTKKVTKSDYRSAYTTDLVDIVSTAYRDDLTRFKYFFE